MWVGGNAKCVRKWEEKKKSPLLPHPHPHKSSVSRDRRGTFRGGDSERSDLGGWVGVGGGGQMLISICQEEKSACWETKKERKLCFSSKFLVGHVAFMAFCF